MTGPLSEDAHRAGFLPDQPIPAGAQPRSTRPPTAPERPGLTAASTGTPSEWEEPRHDPDRIANFADFVIRMTGLLDRQEALEPRNTTKINNPVYTADLTTSRRTPPPPRRLTRLR